MFDQMIVEGGGSEVLLDFVPVEIRNVESKSSVLEFLDSIFDAIAQLCKNAWSLVGFDNDTC